MNFVFAVSLILSVSALYMFVIEAFSVAFKLTGLATKKIRLQVASLFTGTGFTTSESELIANDARRRNIAITCMYTSHIFSVVIMGLLINLVLSFIESITNRVEITPETFVSWYAITFYISFVIFALVLFIKIPPINRRFQSFLERIAVAVSKKNRKYNILTVIDMYGKNAIAEVLLNTIPEFAKDTTLYEMQLTKKYVINILSIKRGKRIIEATKDTMFAQGDIIVVFGLVNDIKEAFVNNVDNNNETLIVNKTNTISLLNNYGPNVLMEIDVEEVPGELDGVTIMKAHLTDKYGINIVVIRRDDSYLSAGKDTIIQKGDKITVFGPYKAIKYLFNNEEK